MNSDDFEKRLQSQPLRQMPNEWRKQILQSATSTRHSPLAIRHSFLSTISSQLSALLGPSPKAWIGLAAGWMVIFALNLASHNRPPMMATISKSSQTEMIANFKDQQKILAELMGSNEPRDADQRRRLPAQPHSELREPYSMA